MAGDAFQHWWKWCERRSTFWAALHSCQLTSANRQIMAREHNTEMTEFFIVRPEKITFLLQNDNTRPHTSLKTTRQLQSLAGLSYHTHRTVRIWHLLTSISSGRWKMKMDNAGNIFLMTPSSQLWESRPPPLAQVFTGTACRLLFIAGKNA
jgi:hypothetical protein